MAESSRTRDVEGIKSLARRIEPVSSVDPPHPKVLVYGRNFSGKTTFGASAPKALILDMREKGTRSVAGSGAKRIHIDTWEDVANAYWYLKSGKHRFESVCVDTVTGMHRMAMDFVIDDADRRNPARPGKQPDKRDYGRAGELSSGMVYAFRNLPMNVIFTAQERTITDEDGVVQEVAPNLPAGVRGVLMDCVGIIGYMELRKKASRSYSTMRVGPSKLYRTKDRTLQLGAIVANPTMDKVIKAWNTTEGDN